jgi:hypothetical protein
MGDRPKPQFECTARLTSQESKNVLKLDTNLLDDLLTLARVGPGFVARKFLSSAADRETILIEKAADLPNDEHILTLIVAAIATPFDRFELREFLLPISENMRLHSAEVAYFTDREIAFTGDRGKLVVIPGFQHRLLLVPLVSVRVEK